jgi:hypothetical protein
MCNIFQRSIYQAATHNGLLPKGRQQALLIFWGDLIQVHNGTAKFTPDSQPWQGHIHKEKGSSRQQQGQADVTQSWSKQLEGQFNKHGRDACTPPA